MSGEVQHALKTNRRSNGERGSGGSARHSNRSCSSSFKTTNSGSLKGGKGPNTKTGTDNFAEGDSLVGPHSSSFPSVKGKLEAPSSSKGNITSPTTNTSITSLHIQPNHQSPLPSPDKSWRTEEEGDSSASHSARLSVKSLSGRRKKKSPARTQFNLSPAAVEPSSLLSSSATGIDQIPKDSISVPVSAASTNANTFSVGSSGGGGSISCPDNNNRNSVAAGTSGGGSGQSPSRSLLIKKERGAQSASPPRDRPGLESSSPAKDFFPYYNSTNPISSTVKTEPADPSIPWIPGTSAPISVDRARSVKITRKILHNWRSACGRTKDRTKDLIRRWKTLPENHPDFEKCPSSPSTSKKKVCSTSNLNNNTGGSPGLGKKKLDKGGGSPKTGKTVTSTSSQPSSLPNYSSSTFPGANGKSTKGDTNKQKGDKVPPSTASSSTTIQKITTTQSNTTVHTELQTTTKTDSKVTFGLSSSQQQQPQQQKHKNLTGNEMPVVGIIGKGLSSVGGGSDGTGGNSNNTQSSSNFGSRLGSSAMMSGMGRPSISVNNSSNALNGRTSGGESSGAGSGSSSQPSGQNKSSTGWTVHVWATYVQRDDLAEGLEGKEPKKPDREYLSDFQKVKLTHFFSHVMDVTKDFLVSKEDFVSMNQRIRHYIEWSSECIEFHILKEVHSGFLECFLNQPLDDCSVMYYCNSERETRQHVNVDEWLDVWGGLLRSARTLEALPLWLQYFPKILFQVINKSGSGTISREELRAFYTMFLGIDFRVVNESLEAIHKAMTDGGRHKITYDLFKLCFANFLLGKYPNGPGQYLFGICSPQTLECSFPIDYSALNTHPDDLEPYDPDKDKSQMEYELMN